MSKKKEKTKSRAKREIENIRQRISNINLVCRGTLTKRTKVCGKLNCRCAGDPSARHGPYYEWSRREKGRLVHSVVSAEQAEEISRAIDNYRKILALLARWSRETAQVINVKKNPK